MDSPIKPLRASELSVVRCGGSAEVVTPHGNVARMELRRARLLSDADLAIIDQEQIAKHVEQDRIRLTLLEGVREVLMEFGGPRSGSYVSRDGESWQVGVWNGSMYEEAHFDSLREALDVALSEDLRSIRRVKRELAK